MKIWVSLFLFGQLDAEEFRRNNKNGEFRNGLHIDSINKLISNSTDEINLAQSNDAQDENLGEYQNIEDDQRQNNVTSIHTNHIIIKRSVPFGSRLSGRQSTSSSYETRKGGFRGRYRSTKQPNVPKESSTSASYEEADLSGIMKTITSTESEQVASLNPSQVPLEILLQEANSAQQKKSSSIESDPLLTSSKPKFNRRRFNKRNYTTKPELIERTTANPKGLFTEKQNEVLLKEKPTSTFTSLGQKGIRVTKRPFNKLITLHPSTTVTSPMSSASDVNEESHLISLEDEFNEALQFVKNESIKNEAGNFRSSFTEKKSATNLDEEHSTSVGLYRQKQNSFSRPSNKFNRITSRTTNQPLSTPDFSDKIKEEDLDELKDFSEQYIPITSPHYTEESFKQESKASEGNFKSQQDSIISTENQDMTFAPNIQRRTRITRRPSNRFSQTRKNTIKSSASKTKENSKDNAENDSNVLEDISKQLVPVQNLKNHTNQSSEYISDILDGNFDIGYHPQTSNNKFSESFVSRRRKNTRP
ncbi:hypothetical protein CDAR_295381 [Caerostris darwini]|uniref:Uncharacterized protein n=1 Tax=Caerostris darwini TaxID=1538125 RepID=A0AAV4QZI2_9ARAC|nr:hypothetical protein CDAR_295381 [Caerostris darwini]